MDMEKMLPDEIREQVQQALDGRPGRAFVEAVLETVGGVR